MSKDTNTCRYCYGHGIYAGYWKYGYRRVMEAGTSKKPMHPNEPRYQCDRCGKPKELQPPPKR